MKRIEFIGAPGVGKSYLIQQLLQQKIIDRLDSDTSFFKQKAQELYGSKNPLSRRGLMTYNLFPSKHLNWSMELLQSDLKKAYDSTMHYFDYLLTLFVKYYFFESNSSIKGKVGHTSAYINLIKNAALLDHFNDDRIVLLDEGLIQNNRGIILQTTEFVEKMKKNEKECFKSMPAAVVFCELKSMENLKRIKDRVSKGGGIYLEHQLSDDDLLKRIATFRKEYELIKKVVIELGIPSIVLDLTEPLEKTIQKSLYFIKNLH